MTRESITDAPSIETDVPKDFIADIDAAIDVLTRMRELIAGGRLSTRPERTSVLPVRRKLLDIDQYRPEDQLTVWRAAKIAKVHVNTIRNWVETEEIGWIGKKGRYRRFTVCKPILLDYIDSRAAGGKL